VNWCVQHRWITIGATVLTFALGIVGMGKVQQQFFPDSSRPEILVDIWFPEGTSFAANEAVARRVEAAPAPSRASDQRQHLGRLGRAALLSAAGPGVSADQRVAVLIVMPKDLKVRESLRVKLPALLARNSPRCAAASSCCPTGRRCLPGAVPRGRARPAALRERADEVKAVMRESPNTRGVNDNWNESVKVLRLEVDQAKARALGVTSQSIAQAVAHHAGRHAPWGSSARATS
jgi:multidrug efflux pump